MKMMLKISLPDLSTEQSCLYASAVKLGFCYCSLTPKANEQELKHGSEGADFHPDWCDTRTRMEG